MRGAPLLRTIQPAVPAGGAVFCERRGTDRGRADRTPRDRTRQWLASDWTWGCIALDDAGVKKQYGSIDVGATIAIRP